MSTHPESSQEHPSTYVVQDRSNLSEMERLQIQDQMVTTSMGGVLPEQQHTVFHDVLDVGCATGNWLLEVAKTYPDPRLVGIDISSTMLEYARSQAQKQGVADRVSFHVMDALRMLEFPDNSFDLVNLRFGVGYLRTWDWPKLLQEQMRVCRPKGIVRLTEAELSAKSSSTALQSLGDLLIQALNQAGHLFKPTADGIICELTPLLTRNGFQNVQTRVYEIEYRGDTQGGQLHFEDMKRVYRHIVPFLRKWTRVPDDYEEIYQQALTDMQQPDFVISGQLVTAWCTVPPKEIPRD